MKYITKRQPTFFPKDVEVTLEQLKEIFTDKAIKAMVEDGFLSQVSIGDKKWHNYLEKGLKSIQKK